MMSVKQGSAAKSSMVDGSSTPLQRLTESAHDVLRKIHWKHREIHGPFWLDYEREAMEYVERLLTTDERYASPLRLARSHRKVFSQNGEDGMIEEIFRRLGTTNKFVVEFGAAAGLENNSVYLLHLGWKAFWIEGSRKLVGRVLRTHSHFIDNSQLAVRCAFVTRETIQQHFDEAEVPSEPDLLSIDIDGNDYWVWEAIDRYSPRVVVMEYNPLWPPHVCWIQKYDAQRSWDGTSYHGASLKSLELLGKRKGYSLVGCDLAGANSFFVRDDLVQDKFIAPFTAEEHYEPTRLFLSAIAYRRRGIGPFVSQ